jgi:hypothetical protein
MAKTTKSRKPGRAKRPTARTRANPAARPENRSDRREFLPKVLDRTVIAIPLLEELDEDGDKPFDIIIDLNLVYHKGITGARQRVDELLAEISKSTRTRPSRKTPKSATTPPEKGEQRQYMFMSLRGKAIKELVRRDSEQGKDLTHRAVYHIWPDFKLKAFINRSISTVKADAAHNAFSALGQDIVWAVIDSGIDGSHPHFTKYENLELAAPLCHHDFTGSEAPLVDTVDHGTHVAGIIAGAMAANDGTIEATTRHRDQNGEPRDVKTTLDAISGMAPRCKLLSLKVLDDNGQDEPEGKSSGIIQALQYIQELNGYGRRILVHGVNLSVGYDFKPEWFACGQSPLCVEVDRLVRSGVIVVVAAGNSGYGYAESAMQGTIAAGLALTINDPGNADLAITVGSTHRDMPHIYGVSYFSSKGPTGDGRMKPDLLAPGEKIVSCAASQGNARAPKTAKGKKKNAIGRYRESSGTSMAAPHVSGVIAAFLSIRQEFIQHPEEVKRIFLETATDLHRAPYFQGRGLVDLMRAIQSV